MKAGDQHEGNEEAYHIPVMLHEAIDALQIRPDGVYVDCTYGGGGHSREILSRLGPDGKLIAFDQDEDARKNLPGDKRLLFIPQNFRHLQRFLKLHDAMGVDGILADLGVSSHQFDEGGRGFSTRFDAALDMRMDMREPVTAAHVLNNTPAPELHKIFEQYGEVTNAKTLANTIAEKRIVQPFTSINLFKQEMYDLVKGNPKKYFAQVFQALRMEVNKEMDALADLLEQSVASLVPGGRLAVITFHSIEDRMVKNFFKNGKHGEEEVDDIYGTRKELPLAIITKKPIVATPQETNKNPRSRSAKLRVAQKK